MKYEPDEMIMDLLPIVLPQDREKAVHTIMLTAWMMHTTTLNEHQISQAMITTDRHHLAAFYGANVIRTFVKATWKYHQQVSRQDWMTLVQHGQTLAQTPMTTIPPRVRARV